MIRASARAKRRPLNPELPGRCDDCLLPECPVVQGYGVGGSPMILGEAPGAQEAALGVPFIGPSGKLLREVLRQAGVDPDEVYYSNTLLCRPPGNATPTMTQIRACADRLEEEIGIVQPSKILVVGGTAMAAVMRAPKATAIADKRGRGFWTYWGEGLERRDRIPNGAVPWSGAGTPIYTLHTYHPAAVLRVPDLFRDFAEDIQKWLANSAPMAEPHIKELVCYSPTEANVAMDELLHSAPDFISCDLETTGVNAHEDLLMSFGMGAEVEPHHYPHEGMAVIIPADVLHKAKRAQKKILDIIEGRSWSGKTAWWNMKFDLMFLDDLYQKYIRPPRAVDGMLLSYLLDERSARYKIHSLKAKSRILLDAEDYEFNFNQYFKQEVDEQEAQIGTLYTYQAKDLVYTAQLCSILEGMALDESPKLMEVHDTILIPATIAFAEIEMRGVQLDVPYLQFLKRKLEGTIAEELAKLQAAAQAEGLFDFNPLSSKQVSELLYDKWGLKKPKNRFTDKKELHDMVPSIKDPDQQQFVRDLVQFRLTTKLLSTYVDGLLDRMQPDERIRSNFLLTGTVTGRLASMNPNIQNAPGMPGVPNTYLIRNAFIGTPGWTFIEADFSQLELRVASALCGEEAWAEAFRRGEDIHKLAASMMFNKPVEEVTRFERRLSKTVDFGVLYGRGARSLVEGQFERKDLPEGFEWWDLKAAEEFQQRFLKMFPNIASWMENVRNTAVREHYVEAPSGRRRRFPFIGQHGLNEVRRQAGNMPIQSTASDITLKALIKLHFTLPPYAGVLFSVHDAIYLECETRHKDEIVDLLRNTMIEAAGDLQEKVPFEVDIKASKRWGELSPEAQEFEATLNGNGKRVPRKHPVSSAS